VGFWLKKKKTAGWLVLSFAGEELQLAHSEPGADGRAVVTLCGTASRPVRDVAGLGQVAREMRLAHYPVSLVLRLDEYQMLVTEAPAVPPEELKAAVRWRVKDMLDYHIDDATLDVLDIPPDPNAPHRGHSLYVVAARNEVISRYIGLAQEADIPLQVIDIPEMASRNIANVVAEPGRGVAMLTFTDQGGLLTVSYGGELYLSRHLDVTWEDVNDEGPMREAHFDRVTLELQRSLDYVERQFSFVSVARLWLAPLPGAASLRDHLAANLYVPVEVLDMGRVFDFSRVPALATPENQARFFVPLGATLRREPTAL